MSAALKEREEAAAGSPEFRYESDDAASFLIAVSDARVLEYQMSMLAHNRISFLLPMDVIRKEGLSHFCFNITSRIPLALLLRRRKLTREEFLKLLSTMAAALQQSAGYLLDSSNFLLDPEHLYVNPESLEPFLAYIPADFAAGGGRNFPAFVSELLLMHVNVPGFDRGNLVQRILSAVNTDVFYLNGFLMLLNEMTYEHSDMPGSERAERFLPEQQSDAAAMNQKVARNEAAAVKQTGSPSGLGKLIIMAVALQAVTGGVLYSFHPYLDSVSEHPATTYIAVILIALALEALLIKKRYRGMPQVKSTGRKQTATNPEAQKPAVQPVKMLPSGPRPADRTELLTVRNSGNYILRSLSGQPQEDIAVSGQEFIIGRLEGHVDHVLANNAVGKLHAQLTLRDGTCYIKDLNSVNGTFVNHSRIMSNKEIALKENDRIALANSEFVFLSC